MKTMSLYCFSDINDKLLWSILTALCPSSFDYQGPDYWSYLSAPYRALAWHAPLAAARLKEMCFSVVSTSTDTHHRQDNTNECLPCLLLFTHISVASLHDLSTNVSILYLKKQKKRLQISHRISKVSDMTMYVQRNNHGGQSECRPERQGGDNRASARYETSVAVSPAVSKTRDSKSFILMRLVQWTNVEHLFVKLKDY